MLLSLRRYFSTVFAGLSTEFIPGSSRRYKGRMPIIPWASPVPKGSPPPR